MIYTHRVRPNIFLQGELTTDLSLEYERLLAAGVLISWLCVNNYLIAQQQRTICVITLAISTGKLILYLEIGLATWKTRESSDKKRRIQDIAIPQSARPSAGCQHHKKNVLHPVMELFGLKGGRAFNPRTAGPFPAEKVSRESWTGFSWDLRHNLFHSASGERNAGSGELSQAPQIGGPISVACE